jgi:hypothetical protein
MSSDSSRGPKTLRRVALVLACLFSLLAWFFIAGETMSDPGGLRGAGLVALWTAPLAGLAVIAWYRPARATEVLGLFTAALVGLAAWFTIDTGGWRSFENGHGPVRAIGVFVLLLPLALLGWRRPRVAGWMLLIVGLVPGLAAFATERAGMPSIVAVAIPATIVGILYLLSTVSNFNE